MKPCRLLLIFVAASGLTSCTDAPVSRFERINVMLPDDMLSVDPYRLDVLDDDAVRVLLSKELPKPTAEYEGMSTEDVIYRITKKRVVWIPRHADFKSDQQPLPESGYVDDYESLYEFDEQPPTLGDLLRGWIAFTSEVGEPVLRWRGISFVEAFQSSQQGIGVIGPEDPKMIDVVIFLKDFIVIMAVPHSYYDLEDHDTP